LSQPTYLFLSSVKHQVRHVTSGLLDVIFQTPSTADVLSDAVVPIIRLVVDRGFRDTITLLVPYITQLVHAD